MFMNQVLIFKVITAAASLYHDSLDGGKNLLWW